MTLNGGNPDALNLRQFLSAGFALLVEAYTSFGVSIVEAVERTATSLGMTDKKDPVVAAKSEAAAIDNTAAMAQLKGILAGVKGAPV